MTMASAGNITKMLVLYNTNKAVSTLKQTKEEATSCEFSSEEMMIILVVYTEQRMFCANTSHISVCLH